MISKFKQIDNSSNVVNSLLKNYMENMIIEKEKSNNKFKINFKNICIICLAIICIFLTYKTLSKRNFEKITVNNITTSLEKANTNLYTKYISKNTKNIVPLSSKVFLTSTGKAFHLEKDCSYIKGKNNLIETTLEEVITKYKPCSRCFIN